MKGELNTLIDPPNFTGSPERRLILAVLERAILDYVGNESEEVQQAKNWLFGEDALDTNPFSFGWVCQQLDLDPIRVTRKIKNMPRRGGHRVAPWYFAANSY